MPSCFFISDLHLSDDQPAILARFQHFLDKQAPKADALYILGDLFDAWIGDDDDSLMAKNVQSMLARLSEKIPVYLQHGNRDFLIGEPFCQASGVHLLADPAVVEIYGHKILLTHGDQLCTLDHKYQQARRQRSAESWIRAFLGHSLAKRRQMADEYRKLSGESKSLLAEDIMDVTDSAVENWFSRHQVGLMIHGHTHRPADHEHIVNGRKCRRVVLDQWHKDRGMYLELDDSHHLIRHQLD